MRKSLVLIMAAGLAAAAVPALAKPPAEFVKDKIRGDNSEVMLGQLAQERGASAGVRDFGRMLAQDHGQDRDKTLDVARGLGVRPPPGPMPEARQEERKLRRLSGREFDREFVRYMINDHRKDIREHEQASQGRGPTARLAQDALPALRRHLDTAQSLAR